MWKRFNVSPMKLRSGTGKILFFGLTSVWLSFSDLTLKSLHSHDNEYVFCEGDWRWIQTRRGQMTFFCCFLWPPWPLASGRISHQVCSSRQDHRASLAPPPPGRLPAFVLEFPAGLTDSWGHHWGRVWEGVWLRVWMDLMCKHWAPVIWWHMKGGLPVGFAGPSSICRRPHNTRAHTHTHTLTPDLCIYALRRHGSKEYGWRGLGRVERGRRLFGLQTETDGVLGGCWKVVYRWQQRLKGRRERRHLESDDADS